ncbi:hypothetical protein M3I54_43125 [Paraburkholderia sp. CNPSo 3274]|uniref:hypothetical protein n=1 Tax=unclassified Paraburkholderia TaxID=2615204 RepID=UPI0020B64761|nr:MULTISPECIES: hypothetical protein [unclassified Paraburkholderia]MCP3713551.1 hypothetical protein [Paraburkholderia sp. CNPSo 3274]MCP3721374.1 hypothetical protein [Paraburkholderia sp. CNPSo 3281]
MPELRFTQFRGNRLPAMVCSHFRIRKALTLTAPPSPAPKAIPGGARRQIRPLRKTRNQLNKYGYGQRALVESQISRIKRCLGARLLTRKTKSQQREGVIIANLVNLWNSFGKAVCAKTA